MKSLVAVGWAMSLIGPAGVFVQKFTVSYGLLITGNFVQDMQGFPGITGAS